MTQSKMPSNIAFKLRSGQPYDVTPVFEGTGAGTAYYLEGKLVIKVTTVAEVNKYIEIPTPFGFTIRDVRIRHDDATQCSVQVLNTAQEIVPAIAIAASDLDVDRAVQIDDTSPSFNKGDDDLRFEIGTGAFLGVIEVIIEPTVS